MIKRIQVFSFSFIILFAINSCIETDIPNGIDCTTSGLTLNLISKQDLNTCNSVDGRISVTAEGGKAPYSFKLNTSDFQTDGSFFGLSAGTYTVVVKDQNKCESVLEVVLLSPSGLTATVQATPDNQCNFDNGTISITPTSGVAPYQFSINGAQFSGTNVFTSLKNGNYSLTVKDSENCIVVVGTSVPRGNTGISYSNEISNILSASCNSAGCHGAGTGSRDWTNFNNVKSNAQNIKTRTGNKTMPPGSPLSEAQISLISCWVEDGAANN